MDKNERADNCFVCSADLRRLLEIHRIDFKWYCDKCYKKYIRRTKKNEQRIL